ncbi:toxic anion resistance protein [Megasphaera elsdenii]|uniref:toxic anion resistance protein n=1 Tax=Megasphaera elsdenii TaxID=907 RepID=UPI0014740009|nr:toxic anion resistance protein [Megasphaera elsdenii]MCI6299923.1 toxic anion resistance protein [Megasphaera elsdenii]MCI7048640.1 toxic anion resistance protein [Megasphaera elsdenii]NME18297.1 toxic anion resistance protein [Megasphaera elsdenii]
MADINLNDLLEKRQAESQPAVPVVDQGHEVAQFNAQVESLTPEERQQIDTIKDSIDLVNSNAIVQYGSGAQKNIANFSNSVLSTVKSTDPAVAGDLLNDLVKRVKAFEDENDEDKGFFASLPVVGSLFKKGEALTKSYTTLAAQIDKIQAGLDNQKMTLMKDIAMFDGLYDKNLEYFKQLQLYIQAGEEKIQELNQTTIPKLEAQAQVSDNPMAVQVVQDFKDAVSRFEKKVHDLKISKTIAIQTAPQIRIIQNNDKILVDRIQSAIYNTIPLWKNQMVLALGLGRQKEALEMQQAVSNTTNELLKRNAAMLKQNSHDTAVENERAIVDIETVKQVNEDLISTIEDTLRIQQEGRQKRQAAEAELVQIEDRLREALLKGAGHN